MKPYLFSSIKHLFSRLTGSSLLWGGWVGLLFFTLPLSAQMRINFSGDSPLRKLQIAEMAVKKGLI